MEEKIIVAKFGKTKFARTETQWRYNVGQKLRFEGVELPSVYEGYADGVLAAYAQTGQLVPSAVDLSKADVLVDSVMEDDEGSPLAFSVNTDGSVDGPVINSVAIVSAVRHAAVLTSVTVKIAAFPIC